MNWADFARAVPDFAAAGKRLFTPSGDVSIGFLATIGEALHLAPVCPIFSDSGIYLSVGAATPKRVDLERDGRYVLHAFLAPNDEEFRIAGRAANVATDAERNRVRGSEGRRISTDASKTAVLVVPTNEELEIARQTLELVGA